MLHQYTVIAATVAAVVLVLGTIAFALLRGA